LNLASVHAAKQAGRTNVRSAGARSIGMAGIVAMVVVLVLSLASSAFASSVTSPLLVLSNYTASDEGMTYSVAFVTPHALNKGSSKVVLQGPDGTTFGNCKKEACKVSVEHGGSGGSVTSGAVSKASVSHGGHRVKIKMPVSASAGDRVIVHIPSSTNSSEPGPHEAMLSTSADKTGVPLAFDLSPVVDIAQVRPNGPGGANDSFVELYAGGPKVSLSGWTLKSIEPSGAKTTLVTFKKTAAEHQYRQSERLPARRGLDLFPGLIRAAGCDLQLGDSDQRCRGAV